MDVTHQSYADYMYHTVLRPLGMVNSSFMQPPVNIKPSLLASGYDSNAKKVYGRYHVYPEQAAAALWTNPTDIAKYIIETQLAYEGKSAKVLNRNYTRLRLTPYLNHSAALGVFIQSGDSSSYFGHSGSNAGFCSQYYGSFKEGNGVVVMVNSDNAGILQEIVNSIAKVYGFKGLLFTTVKTIVKVDTALQQSYTGDYEVKSGTVLSITWKNDQLFGQAGNQPEFALYAEADNKFFARTLPFPFDVEFQKNTTGTPVSAILYMHGLTVAAKKIK